MITETRESTPNTAEPFFLGFSIDMEPVGKGRPRYTRAGHAYTPKKTRAAELTIATAARAFMKDRKPFPGPVSVRLTAVFPVPKSWSKRKREDAGAGLIAPTVKPDADNLAKLVLDALNGIVFQDDKQVVDISLTKRYDAAPALLIRVEEWHA